MGTTPIPVQIESDRGQMSAGVVHLQVWDKRERTVRAVKAWGVCWAAGLFSVVIPILHFVLVPTLLFAGPFSFFWIAAQRERLLGGVGRCPECGRDFDIIPAPLRWPISDVCNHCHAQLKVRAVGPT